MQDEVTQAARDAAAKYYEHRHPADNTLPDLMREGKADGSITVQAFAKFEQSIRHQEEREEEEAHKIGISEGRQEMVREIDLATGGDGEFRWSTEPDRHCPCEEAMKARVIERFHQAERETLARMEPVAERYRHKKRGTVYEVVGTAELQVAEFINMPDEGDHLAIYRGEDGKLWARPYNEFHDGRFEPLPPAPEAGQ